MMMQHIRAAEMLFAGETQAAIGEALGVSERTIGEWNKRRDVLRLIGQFRIEAVNRTIAQTTQRLSELQGQAIETIAQIMNDAESPAPIRLNAARELLKISPPIVASDAEKLKQSAVREQQAAILTQADRYFSALLEEFYSRCRSELSESAFDEVLDVFPTALSNQESESAESGDD